MISRALAIWLLMAVVALLVLITLLVAPVWLGRLRAG